MKGMRFVCIGEKCSTPVIFGDEPKFYSRDVKDQIAFSLCTKCWKAKSAKEAKETKETKETA